jgi:cell wall-associated NlpC family hydrolase
VAITATTLVGAPAVAMAAPDSGNNGGDRWDRVAECESGGNWSANTGNGYSGGLQFDDRTWRSHGGSTTHAYQASKAEQKQVAERTLADQGADAWPTCGKHLNSGSVKPGKSKPTKARNDNPAKPAESAPSTPAPQVPAPATPPAPAAPAPDGPVTDYVVGDDDTLTAIAQRFGVPDKDGVPGWQRIAAANPETVTDPDVIQPASRLVIPLPTPDLPADWLAATRDTENLLAQFREMLTAAAPAPQQEPSPVIAGPAKSMVLSGVTTPAEVPHLTAMTVPVRLGEQAVNYAIGQKGTPYRMGGTTPGKAFDCSGLVQWAYKQIGITLPRVAKDQAHVGRLVASGRVSRAQLLSLLQPGDLLFFYSPVEHVVMYVGDGKIVEAAHNGTTVRVISMYLSGFVSARRLA